MRQSTFAKTSTTLPPSIKALPRRTSAKWFPSRYFNTPGPVWTYEVVDPLFGRTEFNIEFGADERVMAKGEVVIPWLAHPRTVQ